MFGVAFTLVKHLKSTNHPPYVMGVNQGSAGGIPLFQQQMKTLGPKLISKAFISRPMLVTLLAPREYHLIDHGIQV